MGKGKEKPHPYFTKRIHQKVMSLFTADSSSHRKRTATERLTENGDPLAAKKRARMSTQKVPQALVRYSLMRQFLGLILLRSLPPSQLRLLQK